MTLFYATTNLKDTRGIVVHVAFCALLMIHVFCGKIVAIIEKRTELCSRFSSLLSQPNHYKTKCQKTLASLAFQRFILVMLSILMISFLVLSFFGSNLNSRWQQRDWMEERGEFPTRFIIARRSRPTTREQLVLHHLTGLLAKKRVATPASERGEGNQQLKAVYSFTCTFIFHGERKHEKKRVRKKAHSF